MFLPIRIKISLSHRFDISRDKEGRVTPYRLANSEILGTVLVDTNVTVDSEDGVWSKIEHGTIKGFCMSQYLKDL